MTRHAAELLAIEHAEPAELPAIHALGQLRLPVAQIAEVSAERASAGPAAEKQDESKTALGAAGQREIPAFGPAIAPANADPPKAAGFGLSLVFWQAKLSAQVSGSWSA